MTGRWNRRQFVALAVLSAGVGQITSVQTGTAQSDEIETELRFQIELEAAALPAPPAFVRLVRITLEPGAASPAHTHPGPEFGLIESGVVTIEVDGPALVKQRSAEPDDPFEDARQGESFQLDPGDQIAYLPGTTIAFSNEGDEPVEILALVILPGAEGRPPLIDYAADEPTEDAFDGVTSEILGDGIATAMPSGPSRIAIDRVSLEEGQSLPGSRNPVLFSLVSGDLDFTVADGVVQVSRMREPGPQVGTELDTEVELARGDAVFFPQGLRTTGRGDDADELTLLRVLIEPTGPDEVLPETDRGQIRVRPPEPGEEDEQTAEEDVSTDDDSSGNAFAEGDTVYVNSLDVNLRDAAGLASNQVTLLEFNQELVVTGGPTDADDIRWWPVAVAGDESITGFVAEEFIQSSPAE
jgi:quercetin dioxygenase-like cupin family protein